MHLYMHSKKK